ncbi:MAG: hypothetical protein QF535_04895, partial [Anaerolineales bacterium]|nr:hypothetical protein [Anaerolineales bacterium]
IGYKTANLFTVGGAKRVIKEPPLTTLLEENARNVPFSEDNPQMQVSRIFRGIGETSGGLLQITASLETAGALGFGAAATGAIGFGGLGAVRRIADPDIYRELDPVSFVVGTGLDVMLGAAFPWMSKVGGEVIREPNTIKAFSKFLYQTGILTTAITATEFGDSLIVELRKNPDKPTMDVLMDMKDQLNWMQFAKTFSMMAVLHATGTYTRFLPGKKVGVKGVVEYGKDVKGKFDAEWYESLSGKQKAEVLNRQFEWAQENYQKFTDYNPKTGAYEPIKKPSTIAGAQAVIKREVEWMSRIMRGENIPIDSMSGAEAPPEAPVKPTTPPTKAKKPTNPKTGEPTPKKPVEAEITKPVT